MSTNAQSAPVKKICSRCGKDVSQSKRSKDQFGNYYCADCLRKVQVVKHAPGEGRAGRAAAASPIRPASQPAATAAERDDLALQPVVGGPPQDVSAPEAGERPVLAARVVFRPSKDIQWPKRCMGCFAENPQQSLKLGVAPATAFGSLARMGKLAGMMRGLTMRLTSAGKDETGHYRLRLCDNCCAKLSTRDVAALAGRNDSFEPPPYRVQTALLTREIEQRCVVLVLGSDEYAEAFRQANGAAVFDSVEACLAAAQAAEAPAAPPVEALVAQPAEAPAGAGSTDVPAPDRGQAAGQRAASPGTLLLTRPPALQPQAPTLAPGDVTPPALPAVGFLEQVHSLEAASEGPGENKEPAVAGALAPPAVEQASSLPGGEAAAAPPAAASTAPLEEQVMELLQAQPQTEGLYVTPDIAPEKLAAATRACLVPDSECVLALVDCTASGAAENALLFGCKSIYYHNGAGSRSPGPGVIAYTEFTRCAFEVGAASEVSLGFGQFLSLAECAVPPGKVISLLQAVRTLAVQRTRRPAPPPPRLPEAVPVLDDLRQLAKAHLPDGAIKTLGAATWEAEGTLGAKLGSLLGAKNAAAASKERRAGLIAVMADKLFVVDLGAAANGEITLARLKEMGPAKVKSCKLRALKVECSESATESVLELRGDIELKALFPISCGGDNPAKGVEIATAIRCA